MKKILSICFLLILLCPFISFGADTKVSGLTELSAIPAYDDLLMCVDVSDTSMAASGTNKKITYANLLGYEVVGAVGDIQSAIDRAEAASGGIVHLKCGTYTLTAGNGLTIEASDVVLEGSGSCTVLKAGDSSDITVITVGGTQIKRWKIRDLMIDGNKANNASGHGIYVNIAGSAFDSKAEINGVDIIDMSEAGIKSVGNGTELRLVDIYVEGCDGKGYDLETSDMKVMNCIAGNNKDIGFFIVSANGQFTNCKSYGSGYTGQNKSGFYVGNHRVQLVNCAAQDNWAHGFDIEADNVSVIGCQAENNNNGGTVVGTFAGINIGYIADNGIFVGNRCWGTYQDYGIYVVDGSTNNYVVANNLIGNSSGTILVSATALAANNIILDTSIVDARIDDTINSGDATTDGVIDAIRDALITIGLIKIQ